MATEDERPAGDHSELASEKERLVAENRDPAGADRGPAATVPLSALERRARWLLNVYPAGYRCERGEEIVGTLLEASADRTWPRLRDVRALAVAGLKARAAQNRQRTATANLRVVMMIGVSLFLAVQVGVYLTGYVGGFVPNSIHAPGWTGWPAAVTALLTAATVLLAWIGPRVAVLIAGLAASTAVVAFTLASGSSLALPIVQVLIIAGLAALARGAIRPSRNWLWLFGLIAVASPLIELGVGYGWIGFSFQGVMPGAVLVTTGLVGLLWVGIDARLILAVLANFAVAGLEDAAVRLPAGEAVLGSLPLLIGVAVLAAPAVLLLRRQSARPTGIA